MKRMVELIGGLHTPSETIETTRAALGAMVKERVVVEDSPGFVSNQVLLPTINGAVFLDQDKAASRTALLYLQSKLAAPRRASQLEE
ncbi:hypothetical protein WME90_21205 [Sorangium sp. So ce375]|uniref:hypothetical protein n=1 Tax=Sorangium sp. So ce375 TaxID=3133306 RepID=UPI003F5B4052